MRNLQIQILLLAGVLMLIAVMPAAAQDSFSPEFEEGPCVFDMPADAVEGEDIICGWVTVPELHEQPDGKTIRLAMAVIKSSSDAPAPDPLVMFTGGPGGNIFNLTGPMVASPVRVDRDIVMFGERGAYGSEPFLACPELGSTLLENFGASSDEINALTIEAYAACHDRLIDEGVNLNAFNNPQRAADVPLVMGALGYGEYNLWGVSGGGVMAQYVLRQNGDGVRSIMLDSGAFPRASFEEAWLPLVENISTRFDLLYATCAADSACNENYPDLQSVFVNAVAELDDNPVALPIANPQTGESTQVMLTGRMVVNMLANNFSAAGTLPKIMYEIANGDYGFMIDTIPTLYVTEGDDGADGLFQSVACSEVGHLEMPDIDTRSAEPTIVIPVLLNMENSFLICDVWDVERVPAGEVLVSDTPALIMEGIFDTNKPPEYGAEVAANLSNSYLVEFPDKAHVTFGACALDMMAQFMNDPQSAPDTSCVAEGISFAPPGSELSFSPVTLEGLGVTTIAPDGWPQVSEGIWERAASVSDQTTLLVMALPGDDIEAVVGALAEGEGFEPPAAIDSFDLNGRTWTIFIAMQDQSIAAIAATSHEGSVYMGILITSASEFEAVAEPVLLPVIQAFEIAE